MVGADAAELLRDHRSDAAARSPLSLTTAAAARQLGCSGGHARYVAERLLGLLLVGTMPHQKGDAGAQRGQEDGSDPPPKPGQRGESDGRQRDEEPRPRRPLDGDLTTPTLSSLSR